MATDLDGTFIPLAGNAHNLADLTALSKCFDEHEIELVFVTGRHLESVVAAIEEHNLPCPDWILCDVGTSIFQPGKTTDARERVTWQQVAAYQDHQSRIVESLPMPLLAKELSSITGLRLQEPEKQGPFKLSFYCNSLELESLAQTVQARLEGLKAPYSLIHSIDPFNGDGLIDLLPRGVSKAHALQWWTKHTLADPRDIVFAGDSGNDLAAMSAGYKTIVVGNASRNIANAACAAHRAQDWTDRIHLADAPATSGVLEGVRWFEMIPPVANVPEKQKTLCQTAHQLGAELVSQRQTRFRVWAPTREHVAVELLPSDTDGSTRLIPMDRQSNGYFTATANCGAGTRYHYRLEHDVSRPDPASAFQPDGVHGPSQVINQNDFAWTDQEWKGVAKRDLVIYELHIGTFTKAGTFQSAIERLEELAQLGITAIEIMPVAQAPGEWNWGYDGVNLFAPSVNYGTPNDFKALVDACHALGLAVVLDVVYNHLGPEGNYLRDFGPYFTDRHHTPWGEALNFDGQHNQEVRSFIAQNAVYWLREFHLDGLRLDAVHFMFDDSPNSMLQEVRQQTYDFANSVLRPIHLIAESNVYDARLLESESTADNYDAIWSDCLMHAIYAETIEGVKLTPRSYEGGAEIAEACERGYLYQYAEHQPQRVASDAEQIPLAARQSLIVALQTHDSVGNHPAGRRFHQLTSIECQLAAAALVLLNPGLPMIFMGEEEASDRPFPFFANFEDPRLQQAVAEGRAREYPQHAWDDARCPIDPMTFQAAKLDASRSIEQTVRDWYRRLIALRKEGVRAGWLSQSCMTVGNDPDNGLVTLRYRDKDHSSYVVAVRLSSPAEAEPIRIAIADELVAASVPTEDIQSSEIVLRGPGAVVWREAAAPTDE